MSDTDKSNKCTKCIEYYKFKDADFCSRCLDGDKLKEYMCSVCKKYCKFKNSEYCSDCIKGEELKKILCVKCESRIKYKDLDTCYSCVKAENINNNELISYKNRDLLNLFKAPDCMIKSKLLERRIYDIYQIYKEQKHLKNKLMMTDKLNNTLLEQCKNKSPTEIRNIINGKTDFPPVMLFAKHADLLLAQCVAFNDNHYDNSNYVHAVCPYVVDPWNFVNNDSVLLCYYKQFGELDKCPMNIKTIYNIWSSALGMSDYTEDQIN